MQRKHWFGPILMPLIICVLGLSQAFHRPKFASMRAVDILKLTGSGACFGVAIVGIVMMIRGRRKAE